MTLDFDYDQFGKIAPTTGNEKLLYDCIMGDATFSHLADRVEAAADPILSTWTSLPPYYLPNLCAWNLGATRSGAIARW